MAFQPKLPQRSAIPIKVCARCGLNTSIEDFAETRSIFYADGHAPVCNLCITSYLKENDFNWDSIDRVCRWLDLPFIVREWERVREASGDNEAWGSYAKIFADDCYTSLGWKDYFEQYRKLKEVGLIEEELPELREARYKKLARTWGSNYSEEELVFLDDLYKGLMTTQNVNGALSVNHAQEICKLSLEISSRIRSGDKDVNKFIDARDRLIKTAEFTPKNTKNATDFDSIAELSYWIEKRGYQNHFYDGVTRDVLDETLKNIESYNQRLYINEGGIGEAITDRLRALQSANQLEEDTFYDLQKDFDADQYNNDGFEIHDNDSFNPEGVKV